MSKSVEHIVAKNILIRLGLFCFVVIAAGCSSAPKIDMTTPVAENEALMVFEFEDPTDDAEFTFKSIKDQKVYIVEGRGMLGVKVPAGQIYELTSVKHSKQVAQVANSTTVKTVELKSQQKVNLGYWVSSCSDWNDSKKSTDRFRTWVLEDWENESIFQYGQCLLMVKSAEI